MVNQTGPNTHTRVIPVPRITPGAEQKRTIFQNTRITPLARIKVLWKRTQALGTFLAYFSFYATIVGGWFLLSLATWWANGDCFLFIEDANHIVCPAYN